MKFLKAFILLLLIASNLSSQGIYGLIKDDTNAPLPFATLFVRELNTGTVANQQGEYRIGLPNGTYHLLVRSLGYKQATTEIMVSSTFTEVNMSLQREVYELKEVAVQKGGDDPAIAIMRNAIARAPYHLTEVQHYRSTTYTKGTASIRKIPKIAKMLSDHVMVELDGRQMKLKEGQTFLDESLTEVNFQLPNKYTNRVKSLKSSFQNPYSSAINPTMALNSSLYSPEIIDFISPLSPSAFKHYTFTYQGYIDEGGRMIYKIKVTPRRKSPTLCSGSIYIVDKKWCLHTANLVCEQFWGKFSFREYFAPCSNDIWLPASISIDVDASVSGFIASYHYVTAIKYLEIVPNVRKLAAIIAPPKEQLTKTKEDEKPKELAELEKLVNNDKLSKREMYKMYKTLKAEDKKAQTETRALNRDSVKINSNVVTSIDSLASKTDSSAWAQVRSVPLTSDEQKSYAKADSVKRTTPPDTTKKTTAPSKSKILKTILIGGHKSFSEKTGDLMFSGLIVPRLFTYNTVDGFVVGIWGRMQIGNDKIDFNNNTPNGLFVEPTLKYAFSRQVLMGNVNLIYRFGSPLVRELYLKIGESSSDYNQTSGVIPFKNMATSLLFRRNYMRLFNNKYLTIGTKLDINNNWNVSASLTYNQFSNLSNHSDFSLLYQKRRDFNPNIPNNPYFNALQKPSENNLSTHLNISYQPETEIIKGNKGFEKQSVYPTFTAHYDGAIAGILNSSMAYQHVAGEVTQWIRTGYKQSFSYKLSGGYFTSVYQMHFSQFKHFGTMPLTVTILGFDNTFMLLNYYEHSTNRHYLEVHFKYENYLLLLKRLPFISQRVWNESLYFNYLQTPTLKNYTEFGYSLNKIMMFETGIFTSFEHGRYRAVGFKLNINL